jgi:hypothetical protein
MEENGENRGCPRSDRRPNYPREAHVHSAETRLDVVESVIDVVEAQVDVVEASVDCMEPALDAAQSLVDLAEGAFVEGRNFSAKNHPSAQAATGTAGATQKRRA